jgi:O-antigen/teichoic acid export membrane protein
MFKQFLKDSFVYTIGNILVRGVSYLLLPFYTRVLSPTDYGLTDILLVFSSFATIIIALEIVQGVGIYFANTDDKDARISYASTALWFAMASYTVFCVICLIFATPFSEWILKQSGKSLIFSLSVISTWGSGVSYIAINQLRWERKPQKYALTGLITSIVTISLTIILVLFVKLGAVGVVAGQMVGNIAGSLIAIYSGKASYAFRFSLIKLKQMLTFSIPLVPSNVASLVMIYINRVAINTIMNLSDVGIFGVAFRITSIMEFIMMGFRTALTPLIYDNYKAEETPKEIARIFQYFVAFSLVIVLFLSLFSDVIVKILAQASYSEATKIISVMAFAYALGQINIFTLGWAIVKRTREFALINIAGAVFAFVTNFSLIPTMGLSGAAWANLITNLLLAVALMILSQKYYYVPYKWINLSLATISFIALLLIGKFLIPFYSLISNGFINIVLLFIGCLLLIFTGLVRVNDMKLLIQKVFKLLHRFDLHVG